MRHRIALAIILAAAPAFASEKETVVRIQPADGAAWRLVCAWDGEPAIDREGEAEQTFRFPPGRIDCLVEMTRRGGLKVEAVGAGGSRSSNTLIGSGGRSRFSVR